MTYFHIEYNGDDMLKRHYFPDPGHMELDALALLVEDRETPPVLALFSIDGVDWYDSYGYEYDVDVGDNLPEVK